MLVAAVIVGSAESLSPLTQFGGLSLVKRAVLTAQKSGAHTCYLYVAGDTHAMRRELQEDARVTSRLVWNEAPEEQASAHDTSSDLWLLCPVDTIFRHPVVQQLLQNPPPGHPLVVRASGTEPLLALLPARDGLQLCREFAEGKLLRETSVVADPEAHWVPPPPGQFVRRLQRATDVPALEHDLLCSLENVRDGVVDKHLNRKLSRPVTRWLLRTPITPNQITLLAGAMSLVGACCFLPGGYLGPVLGALFLQWSAVLDCCDGEVARIKFMESPLGDALDIVCDTVGALAIFLGIGVAVSKNGASEHALLLGGVLALGGLLAFPLVTLAEKTEAEGIQRGGWEDILIQKVLINLTNRDYSLLILLSAVVGQLGWFLWGAAIGSHVFWMVLAWLLARAGRFALVRDAWGRKR
ncbi:MAG: CDP-alcohol phosphatidyltransferase family protein [Deltaproteobacteria bacterium]|nr:CDP-alcohol phosphatidyltransferase family protein [Deltaproteobacteria bacterium]